VNIYQSALSIPKIGVIMDQIDSIKVFLAAIDEGSLAGAARRLNRSPTAVSRALNALESHVGADLLYRTTRSLRLSETGEHYAAACRRILADLEEAEMVAGGERSAPRGTVTISAPPFLGEEVLRPIIDEFLKEFPTVSVQFLMLDRFVNLVEEGVDLALRIGELSDSSNVATKVGTAVRRVVAASPDYLQRNPRIHEPKDLEKHQIIAFSHFGLNAWTFSPGQTGKIPKTISFTPRIIVNSIRAAVGSAVAGLGLTRLYSYHVARQVSAGQLKIVLVDAEAPPLPVHLIAPHGRMAVPKVRAFVDFAAPRLRASLAKLEKDARSLDI